MKYFKLFLTVFVMAIAMNVSAQSKTTAKSKTTTTTTTAKKAATAPAKKATATATTKPATTTTTTAKTATATTSKPAAASKPATTTTTPKTTTASASKSAAKKSSGSSFFSNSGDYDHGYHLMSETKIGGYYGTGGWGENIVLEHEFHKYLAWDIFSIDFSAPFNFDAVSVGLKTGIRGFSPYFSDKLKMRAYSSLAMGYDCGIARGQEVFIPGEGLVNTGTTASHGFGLSWGIGVQMVDHVFVGYTLEYSTVWKSTSHFAKIAWRF